VHEVKDIYFSGIGGSGVSAIALFLKDRHLHVSGSDREFDRRQDHPLKVLMSKRGISLFPQDGSGIKRGYDLFVHSTAVEAGHVEIRRAKELSLPMMTRGEFLASLLNQYRGIAIAGTSGKSTTAGLLCFLMDRLGLSPNFIGGGRVRQFRTETNPGNYLSGQSQTLIIEACESDPSITRYRPGESVILNVSLDHRGVDETVQMFRCLAENTEGRLYINADDENLSEMVDTDTVTFSINRPSRYRAEGVRLLRHGSVFVTDGIECRLSIPGLYNVYNALSCIAVLREAGIPLREIAYLLPEFRGIERRFEIHRDDQYLVIDDYAHNPQKISALMCTVNKMRGGVCYIFQPHGYGPTRLMKDAYVDTFVRHLRGDDIVLFLPIYYRGGDVERDISSDELVLEIKKRGKNAEALSDRDEINSWLNRYNAFVVFGARDDTLSDLARSIASAL